MSKKSSRISPHVVILRFFFLFSEPAAGLLGRHGRREHFDQAEDELADQAEQKSRGEEEDASSIR